MDDLALVSTGVWHGLQCNMLAQDSRLEAYCSWDRNKPCFVC
jgi:hypothetical protein